MSPSAVILLVAWIAAIIGPLALAFIGRRLFRARRSGLAWTTVGIGGLAWCLGVWAFIVEPATLQVRHVAIESDAWRGPPIRIGVISDTHVAAPHTDPARVRRLVETMNAQRPDVVVLLGDYAGSHEPATERSTTERQEILDGVTAFGGLRSPLGTYGVLGNHDSWFDEVLLARTMADAGVTVLQNQAIQVDRAQGAFWIGGVADLESRSLTASVPQTLSTVPRDAPVVMITHWPDPFDDAPPRVALTMAGHTHCGQVNLPLLGRPILPSPGSYRWPCGLYREGRRVLFVTGGVGVSILPVRFRAPPEIVIITLRAASAPEGQS